MLGYAYINTNTSTIASGTENSLNAKSLEDMLEKLQGVPPSNWVLVSPNGSVYKGENPLILAAQVMRIYQL